MDNKPEQIMQEFAKQQAVLDDRLKQYSSQMGVYALILENEQLKKHIQQLNLEIGHLKEELEISRKCEDPVLAAMNNFRKNWPKEDMVSIIAESERKFGIPLGEGDK